MDSKEEDFSRHCATGAKARFSISPAEARQGIRPDLPVLMARGTEEGSTLLVTAAQHGRELHGIAGIARVFESLDPARLKGSLIMLPVLNPPAVWSRRQDYPNEFGRYFRGVENVWNMNRVWGQDSDTWMGQVTDMVWERFGQHADAIIDLHGWSSQSQAWIGRQWRDLLLAFGMRASVLHDTGDTGFPGMFQAHSQRHGIANMTVELAPQNELNPDVVTVAERGLWNVMRHLGMWPGAPELPEEYFIVGEHHELHSMDCGLCEPLVRVGDKVAAGQMLGRLWRLDDLTLAEEYRAPVDGLVHVVIGVPFGEDVRPSAVVEKGQLTFMMREIDEVIRNA